MFLLVLVSHSKEIEGWKAHGPQGCDFERESPESIHWFDSSNYQVCFYPYVANVVVALRRSPLFKGMQTGDPLLNERRNSASLLRKLLFLEEASYCGDQRILV